MLSVPSDCSDARLIASVAERIEIPREAAADSFILHAPLELTARCALLSMVSPAGRCAARERIAEMVPAWEGFGQPMETVPSREFDNARDANTFLADAIAAGDLIGADAAADFLGRTTLPHELRELLAPVVLPSLAAAGHGSIFLYLLPRVLPRGGQCTKMIRPLARELARHSALQLQWVQQLPSVVRVAPGSASLSASVIESIAAAPRLGPPGSNFIFPIMYQAETTAGAADALTNVIETDLGDAARSLLRCAVWSMLHEPEDEAPYGWSHALTMTQGALGVASACADPRLAVAVAATYTFGFRAALAQRDLVAGYAPEPPGIPIGVGALDATPAVAAAAVFHANLEQRTQLVEACITRAAAHSDAHLVKYTLACLDAAAFDREQAVVYLSAMAYLNAYWHQPNR